MKDEFDTIIEDIVKNNDFRELDNETHHGVSRFGHSMRVAKGVYNFTKAFHFNY